MRDAWPNHRAFHAKADADQAVLHDLYVEVSSTRADTIAGMLVKLRLVVEWQCMEALDARWPTIDEAYTDGLPDGDGICDDTLISLWADAERLAVDGHRPTGLVHPEEAAERAGA